MKKQLFMLLFAAIPSMMMAQLAVNSNGNVYIKDGSVSSNAHLMVSDAPYVGFVSDNVSATIGTRSQGYTTSTGVSTIGIIGESYTQNNTGLAIGVWGEAYNAVSKNFGVVGMLDINVPGAGVYATTEGNLSNFTSGSYAGYFVGDTYVDGNLTTYGLYNLSDMRLKSNVNPLSLLSKEQSPLAKLQNLEVIEYYLTRPSTKKVSDKRHYGVSAQALQEIYPDLVREGQDGYLTVNYVELVPLLLRSIQELKQELDEVKGEAKAMTRSVSDETADFNAAAKNNVLYQNTPNPFKEQTVIRFNLAEDVRDASICIFDMTGKTLKKFPISSGMDSVSIGGYELGEGMFLYSLVVNGQVIDTKRMVISK